MFHQTERTDDNGSNPCFGFSDECFDSNVRDADLLGYRYSVISNLATAPLNNVLCMIPARDLEEFERFPAEDLAFIQQWLQFGDAHSHTVLHRLAPIPTLPAPGTTVGAVDGTAAFSADGSLGFVFLFNPAMTPRTAALVLDESLTLLNASTTTTAAGAAAVDTWMVSEIYPRNYTVATWTRGQAVNVSVEAGSARVLQLSKTTMAALAAQGIVATLEGTHGAVHVTATTNTGAKQHPQQLQQPQQQHALPSALELAVVGADGPAGTTTTATVVVYSSDQSPSSYAARVVSVNGVACTNGTSSSSSSATSVPTTSGQRVSLEIDFDGGAVQKLMPLGPVPPSTNTGGSFSSTFSIPLAVRQQLSARAAAYPIDWQPAENNATWLVPTRLLMSIYASSPKDSWSVQVSVDGKPAVVSRSYNSRGLVRPSVFLGFYVDLEPFFASDADFGVNHTLQLTLPQGLAPGQFQGVFLENTLTEYSDSVRACRVVAQQQ
jgi:hypothetical protein